MYQLNRPGKKPLCTHGPDPAPKGVDVTKRRTVADMVATSGDVIGPAGVPCIGDGTSGSRVQAIYAVASDKTDRFGSVRDLIAGWAGAADAAVNDSANATGGERHIRFVTNPDCSLDLDKVVPVSERDDSFTAMVNELQSIGYYRPDRKYLVWATRPSTAASPRSVRMTALASPT